MNDVDQGRTFSFNLDDVEKSRSLLTLPLDPVQSQRLCSVSTVVFLTLTLSCGTEPSMLNSAQCSKSSYRELSGY